jgi:hypothetical protein
MWNNFMGEILELRNGRDVLSMPDHLPSGPARGKCQLPIHSIAGAYDNSPAAMHAGYPRFGFRHSHGAST